MSKTFDEQYARGDHAAADKTARRCLAVAERFHGRFHRRTANCLNSLVSVLHGQRRYDDAIVTALRSVKINEKLHWTVSVDYASALQIYTRLLSAGARVEPPIREVERALMLVEKAIGKEVPLGRDPSVKRQPW